MAFGDLAVPWLVYCHWVVQAGIYYPAWVVDAVSGGSCPPVDVEVGDGCCPLGGSNIDWA